MLGICYHRTAHDGFEIQITPEVMTNEKWASRRKTTILHEFSHCMLNLPHTSNDKNYMFPQIVDITEEQLDEQVLENMRANCNYHNR